MTRVLPTLFALALAAGCGAKPDAAPKDADPPPAPPPPATAAPEPVYRGPLEPLALEFGKAGTAARDKYDGKAVEVTAPLMYFGRSVGGLDSDLAIHLRGHPTESGLVMPVWCNLPAPRLRDDARMKTIGYGQTVTVRATVRSASGYNLTDTTVVSVGPPVAAPVTLRDIEAELRKKGSDITRTDRRDLGRFKDAGVLVRVTVAAPGPETKGDRTTFPVVYAGDGQGFRVEVVSTDVLDDADKADLRALKAGDSALVLAHVAVPAGFGPLTLDGGRLLKAPPPGLTAPPESK